MSPIGIECQGDICEENLNYFPREWVLQARTLLAFIHIEDQHLQRYLSETAFRYSHRKVSDFERALEALKGIEGKRLTYRPTV